jgi:hypothetical protein
MLVRKCKNGSDFALRDSMRTFDKEAFHTWSNSCSMVRPAVRVDYEHEGLAGNRDLALGKHRPRGIENSGQTMLIPSTKGSSSSYRKSQRMCWCGVVRRPPSACEKRR